MSAWTACGASDGWRKGEEGERVLADRGALVPSSDSSGLSNGDLGEGEGEDTRAWRRGTKALRR